jgi:ribonuclease HII
MLLWPETIVCGVDEAGRGPLAGPVVASAVILDPARRIVGLNDSKKLSEKQRHQLAEKILDQALAWTVAEASVEEIDRLNILHASMLAMRRAVEQLSLTPTLALIDGNRCPPGLAVCSEAWVKGDARHAAIAAASILAKTSRDKTMRALANQHPEYGFERHMGYPTPVHLAALKTHGASAVHRRSFAPVKAVLPSLF